MSVRRLLSLTVLTVTWVASFVVSMPAQQPPQVNPALFSWHQSGLALMMVILGGLRARLGPVVGAFALVLIEEVVQSWTTHWLLIIGATWSLWRWLKLTSK